MEEYYFEGKSLFYRFRVDGDERAELLHANSRYVRIDQEGDIESFFFVKDKEKRRVADVEEKLKQREEPSIKWKNSNARQLLYHDIMDGRVPLDPKDQTMNLEDIFLMHAEYSEYRFDKFAERLQSLRKTIRDINKRAEIDKKAFDNYVARHPVSYFSHGGYIEWQGSDAQRLLQKDVKKGLHTKMSKLDLWSSRVEYYDEFPLSVFRDKIAQEIRTAKYLHTLEVKGKAQGKLLPKKRDETVEE